MIEDQELTDEEKDTIEAFEIVKKLMADPEEKDGALRRKLGLLAASIKIHYTRDPEEAAVFALIAVQLAVLGGIPFLPEKSSVEFFIGKDPDDLEES